MANFLLIGPRGGGKTQILRSFTGKEIEPDGYGTAVYNYIIDKHEEDRSLLWGLINWKTEVKGFDFTEIGGGQKNLENTIDRINNSKDQIILFIFDGTEFIKQIKEQKNGGEIYALWKYYTSRCGDKIDKVFFVATHEDKAKEMQKTIRNLIDDANELYLNLIKTKRYDDKLFDETRFYCINATNPKIVKETIYSVLNTYWKECLVNHV